MGVKTLVGLNLKNVSPAPFIRTATGSTTCSVAPLPAHNCLKHLELNFVLSCYLLFTTIFVVKLIIIFTTFKLFWL